MSTDCVPCHFAWEEKHALPYLPPSYQTWLLREHAELKRRKYPARLVIEHAEREMEIFRRFVPPHILNQIHDDHERFTPVLQAFALNDLPTPTTRIA